MLSQSLFGLGGKVDLLIKTKRIVRQCHLPVFPYYSLCCVQEVSGERLLSVFDDLAMRFYQSSFSTLNYTKLSPVSCNIIFNGQI